MKPIIKYQGGKTKELPLVRPYISNKIQRIVEPFCGGAAVSFGLEIPAILNDTNRDVINLYSVIANEKLYPDIQYKVDIIKTLEHNDLEIEYYSAREAINQPWDCVDPLQRALSYIVVRQLCFSGMERYNNKGEFNVPFGHYKKFSCNLSVTHHEYLKTCIIQCGDAIECFSQLRETDFIFIDPPYLNRLGYTSGDGGSQLHQDLSEEIKKCKNDWLIIHCDDEFYQQAYLNYNIQTQQFNYSQRWGKDKNHAKSKVEHLYISNLNSTI